jgi:cysteinyl-tRNA synthetase
MMALQIWDTARRRKVPFEPVVAGRVGMYVCGMTVQAPPHVGHMRAYVVADMIRRVFRARGYQVKLVQNFTDVDDRIIEKAVEAGVSFREVAERNIAAYFEAADWMGIERADVYPCATDHIQEIVALIEDLIAKGVAYASNGDVFFDVTKDDDYGKLSGKRIDELRAGVRIAVDEAKRHPVDFALWKAAKPGEPSWESPWGEGRPGWHIECSAMAMKHVGTTVDLHGGGRDLVFPHHENELAQSESSTGVRFCNHWIQNGLVNLGGQKMSKSTGVFFLVSDVREIVEPATLRLYLLSTHYRSPIEYGKERLDEAAAALDRIRTFVAAAAHAAGASAGEPPAAADLEGADRTFREAVEAAIRAYHEALDDDFNSAGALGHVFELIRTANSYLLEGSGSRHHRALVAWARRAVLELTGLLGLAVEKPEGLDGEVPAEVRRLVEAREEARRRRDWAAADELRERIRASGWVVEDREAGPLVRAR